VGVDAGFRGVDVGGSVEAELSELRARVAELEADNAHLRGLLRLSSAEERRPGSAQTAMFDAPPGSVTAASPADAKVAFFHRARLISCYHRAMAQILVRQLDDDVKTALQRRARAHGRSTEEEVREILREAVRPGRATARPLGSSIAARFRGLGLAVDIAELRGHPARAADLNDL
jgi:antitoxin FitA